MPLGLYRITSKFAQSALYVLVTSKETAITPISATNFAVGISFKLKADKVLVVTGEKVSIEKNWRHYV
jgi:hypothetical protein